VRCRWRWSDNSSYAASRTLERCGVDIGSPVNALAADYCELRLWCGMSVCKNVNQSVCHAPKPCKTAERIEVL